MSNQGNKLPEGWGEIRSTSKDPNHLLEQIFAQQSQRKADEIKRTLENNNEKR